jgi:hypothetical protein
MALFHQNGQRVWQTRIEFSWLYIKMTSVILCVRSGNECRMSIFDHSFLCVRSAHHMSVFFSRHFVISVSLVPSSSFFRLLVDHGVQQTHLQAKEGDES